MNLRLVKSIAFAAWLISAVVLGSAAVYVCWPMARIPSGVEDFPLAGPIRREVVILGDSQAARIPHGVFGPNVRNCATSSAASQELTCATERTVLEHAKLVVIFTGTDALAAQCKTPQQIADSIRRILQAASSAATCVCLPLPMNSARAAAPDKQNDAAYLDMLQAILAVVRDFPHAFPLDCPKELLGGANNLQEAYLADDRLHLNAQGYAVWCQFVRAHLERMQLSHSVSNAESGAKHAAASAAVKSAAD